MSQVYVEASPIDSDRASLKLSAHDSHILTLIKSVEGAEYDYALRKWTVPLTNVNDLVDLLGKRLRFDRDLKIERTDLLIPVPFDLNPKVPTWTSINAPGKPDFQLIGTSFLIANTHAILGDEQGLGKTKQFIDAVTYVSQSHNGPFRVLVLCKKSLLETWEAEICKFSEDGKFAVFMAEGTKKQRLAIYNYYRNWDEPGPVYFITTYESLRNDDYIRLSDSYHWIVADEAQKVNSSQLNTQSRVAECIHDLWAPRMTALTGSPMINQPIDAWNLLHWLEIDERPWAQFEEETCEVITVRNGKSAWSGTRRKVKGYKPEGLKKLRQLLQGAMLRREKSDVMDSMPAKIQRVIEVELSPEAQARYSKAEEDLLYYAKCEGVPVSKIPNDNVLKMRLTQITSEDHVTHAVDLIRSRAGKSIVFSQFLGQILNMRHLLQDYNPAVVTGSTLDRYGEVHRFQTHDDVRLFIGSTKACREGLTLTAAENVVFLDNEWSPENQRQAEDRAHRIGQNKSVTVWRFVSVQRKKSPRTGKPLPTIDSEVLGSSAHKARVMEKVL